MTTEAYPRDNATTFERTLPFSWEEEQQMVSSLAVEKGIEIPVSQFDPKAMEHIDTKPLRICGKKYIVPNSLKNIVEQVKESEEVLTYQDDWDDGGALATNEQTFRQAAHFVLDYALHIFKNYKTILKTPYIDILRDGSVSVHWETQKGKLLIIFKKEPLNLAYFYAERLDNNIPFKSAIKIGGDIDEFLALWMEKNLK